MGVSVASSGRWLVDAVGDGVGAVDESGFDIAAEAVEARLEVRERGGSWMEAGGEIAVAEVADVPGVDELLEGVGDGETEERFAEGEGFANEVVAGVDDGVATAGEVAEDGGFVEGFEGQVAFRSSLVVETVDDYGAFELAGDIDERAERGGGLVEEDVIACGRSMLAHGRPKNGREKLVLAVGF